MNCRPLSISPIPGKRRSQPRAFAGRFSSSIRLALGCLGFSILWAHSLSSPAKSAERIYVSYGSLERSIAVDALETYARTGKIEEDLAVYTQYADPQQLADLRNILLAEIDLTPVAISQFLYSPQGEILLQRLGEIIQTESRQKGNYALRSALILAAADPEGLTLLNFLQKFPTRGIRINLARSLEVARVVEEVVRQTVTATAAVQQQALAETVAQPIDLAGGLSLQSEGPFRWQTITLTLNDLSRQREFPVDVYVPTAQSDAAARNLYPAPVIVISHGLGSDRSSFQYLAEHLASYGFVVAVPEHPGSNAAQLQALVNGRANEVAEPAEFINRPLDIKYLLDALDRRAAVEPLLTGKLDLQRVGIAGQSFGGYTALALAGASINFEQLQADCNLTNSSALNLSLLLQCRAEELPLRDYNLDDPRIKAAIAINPIDSTVFGRQGLSQIQVPTMIVAGNADTVAPALPEQIRPFTWLTTPEKYLVMIENGTHFSAIGESETDSEAVPIPAQVIGPDPALARRYVSALSVAFFQTYLSNQPGFQPYLTAAYANDISEPPLRLSLVRFFTAVQLAQALNEVDTADEDEEAPPTSTESPNPTVPEEPATLAP